MYSWDDENTQMSSVLGSRYPSPSSIGFFNNSWNPLNWNYSSLFGGNSMSFDEFLASQNLDRANLNPDQLSQWYNNWQGQQGLGMAKQAMGWGTLGSVAQMAGAVINPIFGLMNYRMLKDQYNAARQDNNRRWNAFLTNANDQIASTNYNREAVAPGVGPRMHELDKNGNPITR